MSTPLDTTAVDVSYVQTPALMNWPALRAAGVELAIIKASEGLAVDPAFADHYRFASAELPTVAVYHFLGPLGTSGKADAEHHLAVVGDRFKNRRTFTLCDWENNSATGAPANSATEVRTFLETIDAELGPDRAAWYAPLGLANVNRQLLPWPLWLARPAPDASDWAAYLDAVLVQTGESAPGFAGHPFPLLTDNIFNRETLALLTGEQTVALTNDDAKLVATTLLDALGIPWRDAQGNPLPWPITAQLFDHDDPQGHPVYGSYPVGSSWPYTHEEAKRARLAAFSASQSGSAAASNAAAAATSAARAADNGGTAATLAAQIVETLRTGAIGLTPQQLAAAVTDALRTVAPFLRMTVAP